MIKNWTGERPATRLQPRLHKKRGSLADQTATRTRYYGTMNCKAGFLRDQWARHSLHTSIGDLPFVLTFLSSCTELITRPLYINLVQIIGHEFVVQCVLGDICNDAATCLAPPTTLWAWFLEHADQKNGGPASMIEE